MLVCECHIVGAFPYLRNRGIISATLRTNVETNIVDNDIVLYGPAFGDLSITAYAPLYGETLPCPGRAGVSYNWDRRYDCDTSSNMKVYIIPRGNARAFIEGTVTNKIRMTEIVSYKSFSASAASGPATPYFYDVHIDGYDFSYSGEPIKIAVDDAYNEKVIDFFTGILPNGSKLYLQNFSWEYTPPNVPQVSYSFLFSYG